MFIEFIQYLVSEYVMEVREYQKSDINGIKLLHKEFEKEFFNDFPTMSDGGHWESELTHHDSSMLEDGKFWVMENEGEIIGFVGIQVVGENTAELIRMRVKRKFRRQGLGKQLLSMAEKYCRELKKRRIELHTAKRLVIARRMYEKNGYKLYSEQEIPMPFKFTMMSYYKDLDV